MFNAKRSFSTTVRDEAMPECLLCVAVCVKSPSLSPRPCLAEWPSSLAILKVADVLVWVCLFIQINCHIFWELPIQLNGVNRHTYNQRKMPFPFGMRDAIR